MPFRFENWWTNQPDHTKDHYANLAPIAAIALFVLSVFSSFAYLSLEEVDRSYASTRQNADYMQKQLQIRLLEREEQAVRAVNHVQKHVSIKINDGVTAFREQAEKWMTSAPEVQSITWLDEQQRVQTSVPVGLDTRPMGKRSFSANWNAPSVDMTQEALFAQQLTQIVYGKPFYAMGRSTLPVYIPILNGDGNRVLGTWLLQYNLNTLLQSTVPKDVASQYAVALLIPAQTSASETRISTTNGTNVAETWILAGQFLHNDSTLEMTSWLQALMFWRKSMHQQALQIALPHIGHGVVLRVQAYPKPTSTQLFGSALFWLASALSGLTLVILVMGWRYNRHRLRTQRALLAETAFRRAMEDSMSTGMRALDLQGTITYVNPAFCAMTGWSAVDLIGKSMPFPYWPDGDHALLRAQIEKELAGELGQLGQHDFQMRVKRKNGSHFQARMYTSALRDAKGVQTGLMTSTTDITEPNRIKEQLIQSQNSFITVLEGMDASVSVAPLGRARLLFCNKLYRDWFKDDAQGHLRLIEQAGLLNTNTNTKHPSSNFEIFVPDLNKWLEVRSGYLSWTDGKLAQMITATDVTQRIETQQQAALQAERAQNASRLITMGEMASSVAHELNQPLTAINNYCNGMVDRLKKGQLDETALLFALDKTAKQAHRAGQIIQRIRSFIKRSVPNRMHSEVQPMVDAARELVEIEMKKHKVVLTVHVQKQLPSLWVDPILIEQVLINLMKNAAESVNTAQRDSTNRHVHLAVKTTPNLDGEIHFAVTDTGTGLSTEVLSRLYESFFSTKNEGMGIGLNLCRSIIESHGGRIEASNVYSEANGVKNANPIATATGCCFSFWLPIVHMDIEI